MHALWEKIKGGRGEGRQKERGGEDGMRGRGGIRIVVEYSMAGTVGEGEDGRGDKKGGEEREGGGETKEGGGEGETESG